MLIFFCYFFLIKLKFSYLFVSCYVRIIVDRRVYFLGWVFVLFIFYLLYVKFSVGSMDKMVKRRVVVFVFKRISSGERFIYIIINCGKYYL